jgi:hypothetical protein
MSDYDFSADPFGDEASQHKSQANGSTNWKDPDPD